MGNDFEKRIYDLIALKISRRASAEDLKELEFLLAQYPAYRFLNDELSKPSYNTEKAQAHAQEAYLAHYYSKIYLASNQEKELHKEVPVTSPSLQISRFPFKYLLGAAMLTFIVAIAVVVYNKQRPEAMGKNFNEMITQKGSKSKLILPDGTTVILNADSKISYSKNFNKPSRNVRLTGEAYFDVAHNAGRPFIVHTSKADIKVLGTRFNVRDYPGEERLETSLIKGKVEVSVEGSKTFTLKPSDKLIIDKSLMESAETKDKAFQLAPVTQIDSLVAETSWISNKMVYSNKAFSEIIKDLERQFDVTIRMNNPAVEKYRYTGSFEENNIEDILQILQIIKPFQYKAEGKTITIY
ncbi:FecR family protein [Niabella insulamsoli]|uniref:FecR family protein n=1 Tax=Niabella insulamsoli TaxID=3144874 RepID=UPI0031FC4234